jgi:hypothetical protein
MQKNLFLSLFLLLSTAATQAQNYVPMPTTAAKWSEHEYTQSSSRYTNISTTGDTSYNGQNYVALALSNYGYRGAYREDNKIVYFLPPSDSQEVVLYDFNAAVGDTIGHWYMSRINIYDSVDSIVTVAAIDSMLIGNSYRKRFIINNDINSTYIVEGIGNLSGLLNAWSVGHWEYNLELTCFRINDTIIWQPDFGAFCTDTTVTAVAQNELPALHIYPNPATAALFFDVLDEATYSALFFNALGQPLQQIEISAANNKVNIDDFPAGIFFVQLQNNRHESQVYKLIKAN